VTTRRRPSGNIGTRVLADHEKVKLWELSLEPGESSEWHAHQNEYVFVVIEPSRLRAEYDDGTVHEDNSEAGDAVFLEPTTHRVTNVGSTRYRNIIVELKR
jgi:quercetin dioxygenase-like cupin family protein